MTEAEELVAAKERIVVLENELRCILAVANRALSAQTREGELIQRLESIVHLARDVLK